MSRPQHGPVFHKNDPWKRPVRAATTANITISTALNNGDTLDGVTLATGDRVLVKDQSTGSQNGVYVVSASPARADDFSTGDEALGAVIVVTEGTANADTVWLCTTNATITIDSTDLDFVRVDGTSEQWEDGSSGGWIKMRAGYTAILDAGEQATLFMDESIELYPTTYAYIDSGVLFLDNLPTADPSSPGQVWLDGTTLKVST